MNTLVVYPGRFHPFHLGHKRIYNNLVSKFGNNVYIATSNKRVPRESPFSFKEKKRIMMAAGIPGNRIVQTAQPYRPREITNYVDPTSTSIVFAVSRKDSNRFKLSNAPNGTYMQPYADQRAPITSHGYILMVPIVKFKIGGKIIQSASDIRKLYHNSNSTIRNQILASLYGNVSAKQLRRLFDYRL